MKYLFLLLIFSSTKVSAQAYVNGYSAPASATTNIYVLTGASTYAWSAVNNSSTKKYFVPTKTTAEWNAFSTHLPAGVTLGSAYPQHCKDILGYGIGAPSGSYVIYPVSTSTPVTAYCEMSDDSGGWTRVNASVSSSTVSFGTNDVMATNNIGQDCSGTTPSISLSSISIPGITQSRFVFTRTTTTMQCANWTGMTVSNNYYMNAGSWVTNTVGMCTWNSPWASGFSNDLDTTGLPSQWKVVGTSTATSTSFYSACANAGDNGAFTMQYYVK